MCVQYLFFLQILNELYVRTKYKTLRKQQITKNVYLISNQVKYNDQQSLILVQFTTIYYFVTNQMRQTFIILMSQQNSRLQQNRLQRSLRNIVTQASRQKLLPKILWNADRQLGSKKLINYQKSVKKQYQMDLKSPLKYDPEAAKSDRQKFRDKVMKLMCNQLQVDYFQNLRLKDKTVVTYNGNEIQQSKIQTKKEYEMFKNFNEKKFKETYSNIFDDTLQLAYENIYHNKTSKRCNTLHILQNKPEIPTLELQLTQISAKTNKKIPKTYTSESTTTPKKKDILIHSARKKIISFNEKKSVGSPIQHNEKQDVINIMKMIGGYHQEFDNGHLSLTKGSINRWLKSLYQKSHRIIDFLQIKQVVNIEEFWNISKRLRVMPNEHVLFMTFLYYDGNNDGYICDYDLERMGNLALTRPVIAHDLKRIRQSNIKKFLQKKQPYLQLYKISEVTESRYFEWKTGLKNQQKDESGIELQMKNRMLSSKQKQIFLDFPSFCLIYGFDKPFLWYDLMYSLNGLTFQGLKYS